MQEIQVVRHPGSCALVVVDGETVVLVRQRRKAVGASTTELPQEKLRCNETPEDAASRGLAEECGLAVGAWSYHGSFWAAPAYSTQRVHVLSGRAGAKTGEPESAIELIRHPLASAVGAVDDTISIAALTVIGYGTS